MGSNDYAYADAEVLRRASRVLLKRSTRPKSVLLRVIRNILEDAADKIELEAEEADRA